MDGVEKPQCACVFCGQGIAYEGFDPCQLVLITNWTEPPDRQLEQGFFCHAECFRRAVPEGTLLGFVALAEEARDKHDAASEVDERLSRWRWWNPFTWFRREAD